MAHCESVGRVPGQPSHPCGTANPSVIRGFFAMGHSWLGEFPMAEMRVGTWGPLHADYSTPLVSVS